MLPQGYAVNHFLTDTDAFFILTDCPDGFKHFERSPIATSMEGDFDTGNVRYKARERYSLDFLIHAACSVLKELKADRGLYAPLLLGYISPSDWPSRRLRRL